MGDPRAAIDRFAATSLTVPLVVVVAAIAAVSTFTWQVGSVKESMMQAIALAQTRNELQDQRIAEQAKRIEALADLLREQRSDAIKTEAALGTKIDAQSGDLAKLLTRVEVILATQQETARQEQWRRPR